MEFLRFGSSIPGAYWGCCAMDIIQNFKMEPDAPASIELVDGDGGYRLNGSAGRFAGLTYADIFRQRIRFGTFGDRDMPNHGFLAILTDWQVKSELGKKWLLILKEAGFEFIRTVSNSVYTGVGLGAPGDANLNYLFGLFRNIGSGGAKDPLTPPPEWSDIPSVVNEAWMVIDPAIRKVVGVDQHLVHTKIWDKIGPATLYTEAEVVKAGVTVTYAGRRTLFPQQTKTDRDEAESIAAKKAAKADKTSAFPVKAAA